MVKQAETFRSAPPPEEEDIDLSSSSESVEEDSIAPMEEEEEDIALSGSDLEDDDIEIPQPVSKPTFSRAKRLTEKALVRSQPKGRRASEASWVQRAIRRSSSMGDN